MSTEKVRPSRDELGEKITQFMRMNYSQKDREALIAPCDEGEIPCQKSAQAVYNSIAKSDIKLFLAIQAFTPHVICQVSLVRDVLVTRREEQIKRAA